LLVLRLTIICLTVAIRAPPLQLRKSDAGEVLTHKVSASMTGTAR
jgi:hypothetical protein